MSNNFSIRKFVVIWEAIKVHYTQDLFNLLYDKFQCVYILQHMYPLSFIPLTCIQNPLTAIGLFDIVGLMKSTKAEGKLNSVMC